MEATSLNDRQIEQFVQRGFIRIDHAFGRKIADKARAILWKDIEGEADDPETWTKPVVRLGMYAQEPFVMAANTKTLHQAYDQLVGAGRWLPCRSMGTFPVRFPSGDEPRDTGWHVDASFPGANPSDYFGWRINLTSRGRGLLMLFLFSDVGELDAPTRIRVGSHLDVVPLLASAGEQGLSFMELAARLDALPEREEMLATGDAGTVYLCHPFIAHAAQPHRGKEPRFLAQPPLLLKEALVLERADGVYSPVEQAVRLGLSG